MGKRRLIPIVLVAVAALVVTGCTTWASQTVPSGTEALTGISCPTATQCVAVGNNAILITDNGGSSWSSQPLPAGVNHLSSVSCPTTTNCAAEGNIPDPGNPTFPGGVTTLLTSSDGGSTWVVGTCSTCLPALTPGSHILSVYPGGISCGSATFCMAVGNIPGRSTNGTAAVTNDGGTTWESENVPNGVEVTGVSCPSATFCVVVGGGNVFTTTDGGATWGVNTFPGQGFSSVSCASATFCVAGGETFSNPTADLIATTDGGTTWVTQTPPSPPPEGIAGISCASTSTCEAVANNLSTGAAPVSMDTTDGGTTWTNDTVPSNVASLDAVSCPAPATCFAVGSDSNGNGVIINGVVG